MVRFTLLLLYMVDRMVLGSVKNGGKGLGNTNLQMTEGEDLSKDHKSWVIGKLASNILNLRYIPSDKER